MTIRRPQRKARVAGPSVTRLIPARVETSGVGCLVFLSYRTTDPMSVRVCLCAPSRAVVLERLVLRQDLRDATRVRIAYPGIVIRPPSLGSLMHLSFYEPRQSVTVTLQSREVATFICATDALVHTNEELNALNAAAEALHDEALHDRRA